MEKLKNEVFTKYSNSKKAIDTGSPESQIAVFTFRIKSLTEHLKSNKKDHATRLSLVKLVGKRKKLITYLKNKNIERYRKILKSLSLRK
ncbi:MAG: 30S ribosomal protein S15 [Bacteroidetes bacterium]|nr:30S ribosomal protein S15 [Bacteroidota bacterium]